MIKLKGKQKRMVLFIVIKLYYWILPNKSQTKIIMSTYNTQKIQNSFSILKSNIGYMDFLGS